MNSRKVTRGEIYWVNWNPGRGSEQTGRRPALVIQENAASANPNYPLTIVAAVSTTGRSIGSHVALQPSTINGLTEISYVKCEQIQTVSKERLEQLIGRLNLDELARVKAALQKVLSL